MKPTSFYFLLFFLFPSLSNARVLPHKLQESSPPLGLEAAAPLEGRAEMKAHQHDHLSTEMIITISLCMFIAIVLTSCAIFFRISLRRNPKDSTINRISFTPVFGKLNSLNFVSKKQVVEMIEFSLLESATDNFNESNILGEGRAGCVYKASFNGGRSLAVVKKLSGAGMEYERMNELKLYGRIRHPNIVSLLGYCIHEESKFFIYEFLPNGSLESLLHGTSHESTLTWNLRMKIALDAARGLEYLHENCNPPVFHRDLNSSNILLDAEFNAKISEFGFAISGSNQNKASLKLSGSLGHIAPEYVLDGKFTEKSDVYAFGVILLELLLGRRAVEKTSSSQNQSIVTWAMPQLIDRSKLPHIIDPIIRDTMDLRHLYQVAAVAVLCVQPEASYRPLITDVLHSLVPLVPAELGGSLRSLERETT